ncbi:MAG: hypothetical protein NMNS01_20620 [Nitrosomonas sp.]|nr:MAG: hypothetical protein NMNS01_20620 [Nitrosomonas sp.]
MIEIKFKSMIALIISAVFLFASASTFATSVMDDTRHEQNKIIDPNERDTEKLNTQSGSSSQQNQGQQGQSGQGQQGQSGQMSGGESQNQGGGSGSEKKSGY